MITAIDTFLMAYYGISKLPHARLFATAVRRLSGPVNDAQGRSEAVRTEAEKRLESQLAKRFQSTNFMPGTTSISVTDISSGCGAMFNVKVQSPLFSGLTKVEQHKLITECLKDEIKSMHGLIIETKVAK